MKTDRARGRIRKLLGSAAATSFPGERATAIAIAREIAVNAGLPEVEIAELGEPPIKLTLAIHRIEWRDILSRLTARANGVASDLGTETVRFVGPRQSTEEAIRAFRVADAEVVREGLKAAQDGGPPTAAAAIRELWEAAIAEALGSQCAAIDATFAAAVRTRDAQRSASQPMQVEVQVNGETVTAAVPDSLPETAKFAAARAASGRAHSTWAS